MRWGDLQGVAIYLGRGERVAEVASRFFHVIAVGVKIGGVGNVTLCPFGVGAKKTPFELTFKQIIYDYVYAEKTLAERDISLIWCEEADEAVLEDLFYFAYSNGSSLLFSFYPRSDLLSYFTVEQMEPNMVLLCPKKTERFFLKKNIPIVILCYNQLTFLKNMIRQVEKYTRDIIVIDNCSTYEPLLDYYEKEFGYTLLRQKENFGHLIYRAPFVRKLTGEVYLLTDPDMELNPNLPDNFVEKLFAISVHFQAIRVGFALRIDAEDLREGTFYQGHSIQEWEKRFWVYRLKFPDDPEMELYAGLIDTTFCLVNKRFGNNHIRVAGNYTAIHIPWHKHFEKKLLPGEYDSYLVNNKSTTYWK